jgi:hypothetical protein
MKKFKLVMISFLPLVVLMSFLNPTGSEYYPMTKGIKSVFTHYDNKGNITQIVTNDITDYTVENGIEKATTTSVMEDKKKNKSTTLKFESTFDGTTFEVDLKKITEETLKAGIKDQKVSVSVDGNNFKLPNNLQVGQKLEEIDLNMIMNSGNINFKFFMRYTDRTVTGTETIDTPAGKFDCFIISSQTEVKMLMTKTGTSKSWIAKGVGLVKQEDYNKKGKLISSEILTEFSK